MIGATLANRYRLDAEAGRGGMGVVYRAHDTLLDRPVAVKLLSRPNLGAEGRARLLREARAAAGLNHPNIVSVYDAGEVEASPFIVMELVEGESLAARRPQSVDATVEIARQICAALDHAHAQGIVHRDLKPENIVLASEPPPFSAAGHSEGGPGVRVKLMDFGLARSAATRLTVEGAIAGTVHYMAPEQALGQALDGRADLYALGVMLYELATGRLPFEADDPLAVISQHLNAPVTPPRAYNEALSPAFEALILRLLSKQAEDRPGSAAEVLWALEHLDAAEASGEPAAEVSLLDRIVRGRLVGRERELAEARARWERARAGEGQVLLVSGEPGIGKTRLVRELATQVEVSGGVVLSGECYAEGGAPYAPVGQMVRGALGDHRGLELPDAVLADLLALAPDLRRRYPDVPPNPELDAQAEQQRLFESVVALCEALADRAPLLVFLDDAHWADSGTLHLLRHLARRLRRRRALLVATFREVELDAARPLHEVLLDFNRERLATRLKLTRLSPAATREMLAAMFAEEVTSEFLEGIYQETEGSPFFIEEVCKALVESGRVYFAGGRWQRPSVEELEIPLSVRMAIQARVGRLPEAARETLLLAAILGREFDYAALARAGELDEEALIAALEAAERAQLIEEVKGRGGETFAFVHALIPSTLRESVGGLRRRRLHRRAAQAVEAARPEDYEALAYQYGEAGDEAKARQYYVAAGDRALRAFANAEAAAYYRSALALPGPDPEQARLRNDLGRVLSRRGEYDEAIRVWRQAVELYRELGEADQAARVYARIGRATWESGDTAGGLAVCREGLGALGEASDGAGLAELLHETARASYFNGLLDEAGALGVKALEMAERLGAVQVQADTLATLGILPGQPVDEMVSTLTRAIELAEAAGLLRIASRAHNNLATAPLLGQDIRAAGEHYRRAAELERRRGGLDAQLFMLANAAFSALLLGEFAAAQENFATMRPIRESLGGDSSGVMGYDKVQGLFLRFQGRLPEAIAQWREILHRARLGGDLHTMAALAWVLGEALVEAGEWEEVAALLREGIGLTDRLLPEWSAAARSLKSATCSALGQSQDAQRWLDEARDWSARHPTRLAEAYLWLAQARLAAAERRWGEAISALQAAAESFGGMSMRWYHAQTLREWAEAHLARGEPGDIERARALLREARAAFDEMGVSHYAALAGGRLEALPALSER